VTSGKQRVMKQLSVQKINCNNPKAEEVSRQFDKSTLPFHRIDAVNWGDYPYCPDTSFRIAHNNEAILLNYQVNESNIKAVCNRDNGRIWEDSCVEFFIAFTEDSYYNIECNCIGKILIGKGSGRGENRIRLPESILKTVDRWSSLGELPVENRSGNWEVSLIIPKSIFYPDIIQTFNKVKARGNFYKCGDCLQTPHYLSWNPILCDTPNFHCPEFFGQLFF